MNTALVVDDKQENLYLLRALFDGNGLSVVCARDGEEALELARTSPPNLIISDILMPGMDGFAFCRECKQDPVLRAIPFVFYTATYTDPRDEKLALEMGADRFLVKPLEPDVLMEEVQAVLRQVNTCSAPVPAEADEVVMRQYNQALVRKLEDKLTQLDTALCQRDESEGRLHHLNAVLAAIRSVNQLIVREKRPQQLIEETCAVLTATSGFHAVWLVVSGEGDEPLLAAQRGFEQALFEQFLATIRNGEWPACCHTAEEHPAVAAFASRRTECAPCPLANAWGDALGVGVQLIHEGHFFGYLGVSVAAEFAGIEEESSLLEEVAGDIAFALHTIRADSVRQESEQALSAIFAKVRDGIMLVDGCTRRFLRVNPAICHMLGYREPEILDLSVPDIHPAASLEHVSEVFAKQLRGEEFLARDIPVLRKDGSVFLADINATVLESSGRSCVLGVFRDMTERQQAEEEKETLQAQLNQAQKMESIGRLAGGVAHDFNNMLSVILGHAELALEGIPPGQPLAEDLTEIYQAARRSADLTRQLLAFSRTQAIDPKVLDLDQAVGGMLKMLGRLIGEDIRLAWVPGEDTWPVRIDPTQVDQILVNLCVNARDAITGVGRLMIETANVAFDETHCAMHPGYVPGEYVLLAVSDDGSGMDKETLGKLFEPLFTTKELGKGTGLGLATVYGIVKQNNGFINVYSEPGQGTTFRIHLPRTDESGPRLQGHLPAPTPRGNETILLVEDEPAILRMTASMLKRQGYTVLSTDSPSEAIRLAESHPGDIQLLVTDLVMPGMGGRELAATLHLHYPALRILFMSGYMANMLALRQVLDEGAVFLGKPFSIKELIDTVRKALGAES